MSTAAPIKPQAKVVFIVVALLLVWFGYNLAIKQGWIAPIGMMKSTAVMKASLPDPAKAVIQNVEPAAYPSTTPNGCQDPIRSEIWAWNAQIGALYANGGLFTTRGSLSDKRGACVKYDRQDDTSQMKTDLLACASELKSGTECQSGVHFITIMGDGAGQFIGLYNAEAKKICPDCTAEIVGTTGFSRGEDALWGPASWKTNPQSALGDGLIAGVLRDGDWDTHMKWGGDNNLLNNPDEKTYDPKATNWVNAKDYIDAAQKYVAGYCEDRTVVNDGKPTGEKRNVCVKAVVTWTPGDVIIAHKRGGLVRIVSTKDYPSQMPSAIIGIKKWNRAHADKIAPMLAAILEGGDQVKAFPEALKRAGDISAAVYCQGGACSGSEEGTGAYWVKYYKGVTEPDAQGHMVDLGGSFADNMNDALAVFGLTPGANNNFKATYSIFAKIVDQQYHKLFLPTPIPPYEQAATTNYLLQAKSLLDNQGSAAERVDYSATAAAATNVIGHKNYDIQFNTGSDKLTAQGQETVAELKDQLAITQAVISLAGHTDNTGNPTLNDDLSRRRAKSVKEAIQQLAPDDFPDDRFHLAGYGSAKPIASNTTDSGRAKNRRVEVTLAD